MALIDWPVLAQLGQGWDTWGNIGQFLQGIATVALLLGGGLAAWRYFRERRHQADQDLIRLRGEVVTLARQRYELARGTPGEAALRDELARVERQYDIVLRGLLRARKELVVAEVEAMSSRMQELLEERERREREGREGP